MTRLTPSLVFQQIDDDTAVLADFAQGAEIVIPAEALGPLARTADYFRTGEPDPADWQQQDGHR